MRFAVMASGRGSNFDALLRSTREPSNPAELVVLVTDRPGAPVVDKARAAGIVVEHVDPGTKRGPWTAEGVEDLLRVLEDSRVDGICLAGFMRILPAELIRAYPQRILNVHPSLLPSFPGLRPHRQVLRAGVKVSGCTVHLVDEGVDTGPILLQAPVPVERGDTEDSLAARVLEREHVIYPQALRAMAEGRLIEDGKTVHLDGVHVGVVSE